MKLPAFDKTLHFAAGSCCTAAGLVAAVAAHRFGVHVQPLGPLMAGLGACLAAAVLREVYNKAQGGVFDPRDIAATLLGSLPVTAGALVGYAL